MEAALTRSAQGGDALFAGDDPFSPPAPPVAALKAKVASKLHAYAATRPAPGRGADRLLRRKERRAHVDELGGRAVRRAAAQARQGRESRSRAAGAGRGRPRSSWARGTATWPAPRARRSRCRCGARGRGARAAVARALGAPRRGERPPGLGALRRVRPPKPVVRHGLGGPHHQGLGPGKVPAGAQGGLKLTLTGHVGAVRGLAVSPRSAYAFSSRRRQEGAVLGLGNE